uniref:HTH_Tnp_Tc3_2 domain-containing protein n=1 Tax=Heterorhabditis bacteriophora TaxID=37862 RepID=A0A1I7X7Q6_HETBA
MGRASTLSLHERGQIKALSTTGYPLKRIVDVVKRSRKGTTKSNERPSKLNDREKGTNSRTALNSTTSIVGIRRTCGIDASKITVWRILDKRPNIVRSRMKKCPQLTQRHKDERLCWAKIFMRYDWEKVQLL